MMTHDLVKRHPRKALSASLEKTSCALVCTRSALSQTLDDREKAFSFPLSTRAFFLSGVISSTEVAGEAALVGTVTLAVGTAGSP